ncbi:MAG: TrkH family potassium uptake protein [Candidatus Kapaibacterium sp.]
MTPAELSELKKRIRKYLDLVVAIAGFLALVCLVAVAGFYLTSGLIRVIMVATDIIVAVFIIQEVLRAVLSYHIIAHIRERWKEALIILLLLVELVFPEFFLNIFSVFFPEMTAIELTLLYLGLLELSLLGALVMKSLRYFYLFSKLQIHPGAVLALSFLGAIIFGTLLLMLPRATPGEGQLPFVDALFTSTSAICVTGLVVVDTATDFTAFGQAVIFVLLQAGGLGIMTLTTFFASVLGGGLSIQVRLMLRDMMSSESVREVSMLLGRIALFTFLMEAIGAAILYYSLTGDLFTLDNRALSVAVFHSVSAFCNAGFSLFSDSLMNPMVAHNYGFLTTIMALIIIGGLGFAVIMDLSQITWTGSLKYNIRRVLSVGSRLVLAASGFLIIGGTINLFLLDTNSFGMDMTIWEKMYHAAFLSITSRTAGFNTTPTAQLTGPVALMVMMLMWIGASPGSTGGGIKTTTFSLAVIKIFNYIRGYEKVEIYHREIEDTSVHRAFMVILTSVVVLGLSSLLLVHIEPDKDMLDLLFEATSAISTVGLSRDVTFHLGTGGKYVIIFLMFVGRIGVLSFFMAFFRPRGLRRYSLPRESVVVG